MNYYHYFFLSLVRTNLKVQSVEIKILIKTKAKMSGLSVLRWMRTPSTELRQCYIGLAFSFKIRASTVLTQVRYNFSYRLRLGIRPDGKTTTLSFPSTPTEATPNI